MNKLKGIVNGVEVNSHEDFLYKVRNHGPFTNEFDLYTFASKVSDNWRIFGTFHEFLQYDLTKICRFFTNIEWERLIEIQQAAQEERRQKIRDSYLEYRGNNPFSKEKVAEFLADKVKETETTFGKNSFYAKEKQEECDALYEKFLQGEVIEVACQEYTAEYLPYGKFKVVLYSDGTVKEYYTEGE